MEKEVVTMVDELNTLENVLLQQTSRQSSLVLKNQSLGEFTQHQQERVTHQKSLIKTLQMMQVDQNELTEKIEVKMYESTKEKAEIGLSQEAICDFMEIFNRKLKELKAQTQKSSTWAGFAQSIMGISSTPKDTVGNQDIILFDQLPSLKDKQEVNKALAPHGYSYHI